MTDHAHLARAQEILDALPTSAYNAMCLAEKEETMLQYIAALAQAAQPVWSTNKPKVAGWYWYVRKFKDGKYGPIVLEVNDMGCVEIQGRWEKIGDNLGDIHGEWAGPLPMPREA